MSDAKRARPLRALARAAILGTGLLALWLYLWVCVDTSLIYHSQRRAVWFPAPPSQRVFASQSLARPGGPLNYASAYLSQFYFHPALGAAIVTAVAGLLALASGGYLSHTLGGRPQVLHLVPALLVALPFARYDNALGPVLAVLAATAAAWAFASVPKRRPAARIAAFLLLTAACHWLAGGASLVMALLCVLHELLGRRWTAALACLGVGAAAPFVGAWAGGIPVTAAYGTLLPTDPNLDPAAVVLTAPLYLALLVVVLASALVRGAFGGRESRAEKGTDGRRFGPALRTVCGLAVVLGVWGAALALLDVPLVRAFARIDRALDAHDWGLVIRTVRGLDPRRLDRVAGWDLNRALCHAGRLSSEMFRFPQSPTRLLPLPVDFNPDAAKERSNAVPRIAALKCLDTMYELGQLNEAELSAHEAWQTVGERPRVMRKLAMINIAKGQPEAARAFLASMRSDPVWGCWSRRMLERLRADPGAGGNAEVNRLRASRATRDRNAYITVGELMGQLVESRPDNKMAYEYLMAYYLLTRQLGKFMVEVRRVGDFGYPELPLHFEEALSLYGALAMKDVQVPGYKIRPQTAQRVKDFLAAVQSYGADHEYARQAVAGRYEGSYMFYYFFGRTGD